MKSMQLKQLNSGGYEVILVTSGAVGLGRQRLRYRRVANSRSLQFPFALTYMFILEYLVTWNFSEIFMLTMLCYSYDKLKFKNPYMFCSFADLQNPHTDFDGKACAAVGQSSLMALYDTMFSQVQIYFLSHIGFTFESAFV